MRTSVSRRELRQIEFVPERAISRTVLLRIQMRPASRCVKGANGMVAISLTGSEVRLLCSRHWRIHRRTKYRIAARTRKANLDHIPNSKGWTFSTVFVSEDRRVRVGWEISGRKRRRVVQLFPKPASRIRLRRTGCIWWPTVAEVDALAGLYGKPIAPESDPQITRDQLERMKSRLREMFLRRHPYLAPPRLGGLPAPLDAGPPAGDITNP